MTENIKQTKDETEDQELSDLLDNALKDFDKISVSNTEKDNATSTMDLRKETDNIETSKVFGENWTEDFLKQTADQFEKNLQNLLQNGDTDLEATLQKLGQASINNTTDEKDSVSADFQSAISQVLKDLTANSENLQNDADLAAMLGQTSLDGETSEIVLPFMQGMMEHLLSKEILYPSLKELSDKYPIWLEENKATLNSSDLQRYTKQLELMQKVCIELEKEKEDDTEDIKKHRFEDILKLMTEMQNYGQAPEDLISEQCSLFQFDSEGNPILPLPSGIDSQQDCCIM